MLPRAEPQTAPQQSRMEIEKYIVATDQQLIEFVLGGDSIAFEHLFNRYRDSIYQLYIQRTGGNVDDTNDLLQETFVKVFLKLHTYNPEHTFGKWVYTIARNTFIDFTRRRRLALGSGDWNPQPDRRMERQGADDALRSRGIQTAGVRRGTDR